MSRSRSTSKRKDDGWSEHGGYMKAKQSKLGQQFMSASPILSDLFRDVSIYVNGYTDPPASKLRELIVAHGGRFETYYSRSSTTYIITNRLPVSKINRLSNERIVAAKWITDSIKAKRLLSWQDYQMYPGRLGGSGQRQLRVLPAVSQRSDSADGTSQNSNKNLCHTSTLAGPESAVLIEPTDSPLTVSETDPVAHKSVRAKQLRLDSCISPPKPPTAPKPPTLVSLKQILQSGSPLKTTYSEAGSSSTSKGSVGSSTSPALNPTDAQLATFYARSRLHHLSSWANELHAFVRHLRDDPTYQSGFNSGALWKESVLSTGLQSSFVLLESHCLRSSSNSKPPSPRILLHIDMDCFFVSVSIRRRPDLKDKPIAITHAKNSTEEHKYSGVHSMSEVASCSYAARKAGVRNGMLLGQARQLCSDLVTLPYDFDAYKDVSETLYRTVAEFVPNIEAVSCDELYADCSDFLYLGVVHPDTHELADSSTIQHRVIHPLSFGGHLRTLVEQRTGGCTASIGFGSSKLLARLATKRAKPNGQTWLLGSGACAPSSPWRWSLAGADKPVDSLDRCELTGSDEEWLKKLPLQELPGIGDATVSRLATAFGVTNCGDLMRNVTRRQLINLLGSKTGERVYWLCRARDTNDEIQLERFSKSVSACMNYGIRLQSTSDLANLLRSLVAELASRMSTTRLVPSKVEAPCTGVLGRNLVVRVFVRSPGAPVESVKFMGHGVCTKSSRTVCFPEPTADVDVMFRAAMKLVRQLCPDPKELRGIGLQVQRLLPIMVNRKPSQPGNLLTEGSTLPMAPSSDSSSPPANLTTATSALFESDQCKLCPGDPVLQPHEISTLKQPIRRRSLRMKLPFDNVEPGSSSAICGSPAILKECSVDLNQYLPKIARVIDANGSTVNEGDNQRPQPVHEQGGASTFLQQNSDCRTDNHVKGVQSPDELFEKVASPIERNASNKPIVIHSRPFSDAENVFANKSIDQIRLILANWIISEPCPLFEDVCILASYLVSLVPVNLERVRLCLLCLDRLINQLGQSQAVVNTVWKEASARIRATVDQAIARCLGSRLQYRFR